jgi:hypothetical protein
VGVTPDLRDCLVQSKNANGGQEVIVIKIAQVTIKDYCVKNLCYKDI